MNKRIATTERRQEKGNLTDRLEGYRLGDNPPRRDKPDRRQSPDKSATPRTDDKIGWFKEDHPNGKYTGTAVEVVSAEFARSLEIELSEVTRERDEARSELSAATEQTERAEQRFEAEHALHVQNVTGYQTDLKAAEFLNRQLREALEMERADYDVTPDPFMATHRHKEGGLYEMRAMLQMHIDGEWLKAVRYRNEGHAEFVRTLEEFYRRFDPIDAALTGGKHG